MPLLFSLKKVQLAFCSPSVIIFNVQNSYINLPLVVEQYSSVSLAVCDESLNQLIFQCDTLWEMDFFKCAGMYVQASNKVKGYISYRYVCTR